jgi:hypothetical protein
MTIINVKMICVVSNTENSVFFQDSAKIYTNMSCLPFLSLLQGWVIQVGCFLSRIQQGRAVAQSAERSPAMLVVKGPKLENPEI